MSHSDDISKSTRTTEVEVAIKKIFSVIEFFEFLLPIDLFMIYKSGIRIYRSNLSSGK